MDEGAIPMWIEDTVLHIGAEATAIAGSWMGRKAVLKKREPRAYRHPSLDRKLTRQRLAAEARILSRLQSIDFPSPSLLDIDADGGWMLLSRKMECLCMKHYRMVMQGGKKFVSLEN
tara:strand:- start:72 stop:422 length:351 start_codon:yes stop_codon:yes gene_type:complete